MSWFSSHPSESTTDTEAGRVRLQVVRVADRMRGSFYIRNVAMLIGGTAMGQAVVILASPVLTRIYTPSDFGLLAIFTAVVTLFMVVGSLRFEVGVPLAPDNRTASDVLWLSVCIVVALSLLVGLVAWLGNAAIASHPEIAPIRDYLWLLPIAILGGGLYRVFNAWATRVEAYGPLARTKINQGLTLVIGQIGIGLLRTGPVGLLLGWTAGQTAGVGTLAMLTWRQNREAIRRTSVAGMVAAARRYWQLAMMLSASTILNTAVATVPAIYLASYHGLGVAGAYALGQRVVAAPMELVAGSMAQVYFGEAYRLKREDPGRLYSLFLKTVVRLAAVGTGPLLLIALSGPWVFSVLFGSNWREAGQYLQVLAPMLVIQFIYNGFAGTLEVLERKTLILIASLIRALSLIAGVATAYLIGASAIRAVALIGAGALIGYLSYGLISWRALAKEKMA
jgi:O-antigen/teichoic acid export membrane protein